MVSRASAEKRFAIVNRNLLPIHACSVDFMCIGPAFLPLCRVLLNSASSPPGSLSLPLPGTHVPSQSGSTGSDHLFIENFSVGALRFCCTRWENAGLIQRAMVRACLLDQGVAERLQSVAVGELQVCLLVLSF